MHVCVKVCHNLPGDGEEECRGVSTDEEDEARLPDTSRPPPQCRPDPPPGVMTPSSSSTAAISLDAYESEREKRKLTKANECLQQQRKLGYDKNARESILMDLKVKNQLFWRCRECEVTCGKAGMEKHIVSKMHWDKVFLVTIFFLAYYCFQVLEIFKKSVDSEQPPINR